MHRILERQLKRFLGSLIPFPKEWQDLLSAISETYAHFDEDRALIERSLEVSSKELTEINGSLKEKEADFRTLTDNIPEVIVRFDASLRCLYINKAVEGITGLAPEKFIGKVGIQSGFPASMVKQWAEKINECFKTKQMTVFEFPFSGTSGPRVFETRVVPEFAADKTVPTVLAINYDITDRKLAEENLKTRAVELEKMNQLMVDRELKMVELKNQIKELKSKSNLV